MRRTAALRILLLLIPLLGAGCVVEPSGDFESGYPSLQRTYSPSGYTLAFSDDFSGNSLNTAKWYYRSDSKAGGINGSAQVSLDGAGHLKITGRVGGFRGGGIISRSGFKYGYYEASISMPSANHWHAAFWTFAGDGTSTDCGRTGGFTEIDIAEYEFQYNPTTHKRQLANVHAWTPRATCTHSLALAGYQTLSANPSIGYHTYGALYTPNAVEFYFDGRWTRTILYPASEHTHDKMNIWLTMIARPDIAAPTSGGFMYVDWVRYHAPPANPTTRYYGIVNHATGQALHPLAGRTGDGVPVTQYSYDAAFAGEQWSLLDSGASGGVLFKNKLTGKCLRTDGTRTFQWTCNSTFTSERWDRVWVNGRVSRVSNMVLKNRHSAKSAKPASAALDAATLQAAVSTGDLWQRWELVPVEF